MDDKIQQEILDELKKISESISANNKRIELIAQNVIAELYELKGEASAIKNILIRISESNKK